MKNKKYMYLSVLVPLLGLKLSRVIVSKYGEESRSVMMTITLVALVITFIVFILKKRYSDTVVGIVLSLPILIGAVGVYLDNLILMGLGIGLLLVVIGILLIVKKRHLKDKF